jgi:drug/metabolite transporter (DMT)-like permease
MPDYVLLTLASSSVYATATALQKHGIATRLPEFALGDVFSRFGELFAAMLKNPVWLLGLAVIPMGLGLEIQAVSTGDISVVRPLSRLESAFSVLIGVFLLGERLAAREGLGVFAMIAGALVLTLEPEPEGAFVPDAASTALALGAAGALAAVLLVAQSRRPAWVAPEYGLAAGAGLVFALADIMMKLGTSVVKEKTGSFHIASAQTAGLFFQSFEFWLFVAIATVGFVVLQIAYSHGRVSVIVPVAGIAGTLLTLVLGSALLREPLSRGRVLGVLAMVVGIALVLRGPSGSKGRSTIGSTSAQDAARTE